MASLFREPGLILSSVAHVAMLTAGLVAFTSAAPFPDVDEGIPVEFITENQFSEITRGETNATEVVETPQPRAEREAEVREVRPPGEARVDSPSPPTRTQDIPVADQPVEAAEAPPPPPPPPPPPAVAAPAPAPEPAPVAAAEPAPPDPAPEIAEEAPAETPSVAESAPLPPARSERAQAQRAAAAQREQERVEQARAAEARRVAEARAAEERARQETARQETARQEQARQEAARQERTRREAEAQRLAQAKAREEEQARARREAETAERFNPGDIAAILRSTAEPRSQGASAPEPNRTASLGTATGAAARLNPSQRDALVGHIQGQLRRCWSPPPTAQTTSNPPVASVRIALNLDGSLAAQPQVVNDSADPLFRAIADSATRATQRCAPLQIPAQFTPYYEDWKNMTVNFNPLDA